MNGNLYVKSLRHAQARIDGRGRRTPILMQLQPACSCAHLLRQRLFVRRVSFSQESEIHRPRFRGSEHLLQIPRPGVHVVALVPVAGPVPPPIIVVIPFESAS